MAKMASTFMAIGGGDFSHSPILERISAIAEGNSEARMLLMTVATNHDNSVAGQYGSLFRKAGFRHVSAANSCSGAMRLKRRS